MTRPASLWRLRPGEQRPAWYRLPWGSSSFAQQAAGAGHCDRWDPRVMGWSCTGAVGEGLELYRAPRPMEQLEMWRAA
jgi:hypothetical protein